MKYNVISYFLKEGFSNLFKNKKSTLSCLGVMCATMLMFGLFYAIGMNITSLVDEIQATQAIRVFALVETTDEEFQLLGEQIKNINGVNTVTVVTKEEAYNEVREGFGDKAATLDGIEPEVFSDSYLITLTNLDLNEGVQTEINKLNNVKRITSNNETIKNLSSIAHWIKIVTGATLAILILISVFIISNTIKLTVHARRKEISIMKYVGATNGFIRTPFIIEGIIIGILSAILSIILIGLCYSSVADAINASTTAQFIGVSILNLKGILTQMIVVFLILGAGIGMLGSTISMRKYLHV